MAFTVVFLQELITGKGVIEGIQNGNVINMAFLGGTVLSIVGLTAFLASKGDDEFADYE
jgi:SNF family Na+-dependent transporter